MNRLTIFISALCLSSFVSAYDTEIYGTAGNTVNNRVNPNVLFIVDTSGSMRGSVAIEEKVAFDPTQNYTTSRETVMDNPNYNWSWGWDWDDFKAGCADIKAKFKDKTRADRVLADHIISINALQERDNVLQSLQLGKSGDITCYPYEGNEGYKYTFYSPNYSTWVQSSSKVEITSTRMDVIKDVVSNLTENLEAVGGINLGLMRFNNSNGGKIDEKVADIASNGHGQSIRDTLATYSPVDSTPLTETLHEAALYFRGDSKKYSGSGKHISPITAECQKNHIILFTDGEPSNDEAANSYTTGKIAGMNLVNVTPSLNKSCTGNGGCLDELAYWMRNTDHAPNTFTGDQYITTHTIGGFNLDAAASLLSKTATHGGGTFYEADDASEISEVLTSIFIDILSTDTTFTAPAVAVNAFNATTHTDELFYALFRPEDKTKWGGNLKKYRLSLKTLDDDSTIGVVLDSAGNEAVDLTTGYFFDTTSGFWNANTTSNGTLLPDGKNVLKGGMANLLTPANRKIFTDYMVGTTAKMAPFSDATNGATETSFNIPKIIPTDATADTAAFNTLKDWVTGIDVLDHNGDLDHTDSRKSIGDPLHSEPVIVTYGGSEESPDATIFFGTNEGFIHGINTLTETTGSETRNGGGQEVFAFIPKELHHIQNTYFENPAFDDKPYGMDGLITTWHYDLNDDNRVYSYPAATLNSSQVNGVTTNEHVYLYAGMRRGGRSYYGLNITDRADPEMLFKITGGAVADGGTPGFEKLGETWSGMTVAKVKFNKKTEFVLFFTGGYDASQDSNEFRKDDTVGNAIYMVNATTGALMWTASNTGEDLNITEMKNSMPASLSAIDILKTQSDGVEEGYIDYLIAADTGGRVFRIDINQENTGASDFATGGMIAQVGGNTAATNLRFYNKPNVSLVSDNNLGKYLTISIGSGYRAHPLNKVIQDRFFVIKDYHPFPYPSASPPVADPTRYSSVIKSDSLSAGASVNPLKIYNATGNLKTTTTNTATDDEIRLGGGFYINMETAGEKVLAASTTSSGQITFSSFSPSSGIASGNCGADTGSSKVYVIGQKTAEASAIINLKHPGIAPRAVVIIITPECPPGVNCSNDPPPKEEVTVVGTEVIKCNSSNGDYCPGEVGGSGSSDKCATHNCAVNPVYWHQKDNE